MLQRGGSGGQSPPAFRLKIFSLSISAMLLQTLLAGEADHFIAVLQAKFLAAKWLLAFITVYVGIVLIALVVTILGNSYLQTAHAARVGNQSLIKGPTRRSSMTRRRGSLKDMSGAVEFQECSSNSANIPASNSANIPIPETQPFALEQLEYGEAEERLVALVSAATDFLKKREAIARSLDYCVLETMQAVTM